MSQKYPKTWVKGEGTVDYSTVTRLSSFLQPKQKISWTIKQGQVSLKLDSEAVLQAQTIVKSSE